MLNHDVFNRTDDYMPPIDLPKGPGGVVEKEGWASEPPRPRRAGVRTSVVRGRNT